MRFPREKRQPRSLSLARPARSTHTRHCFVFNKIIFKINQRVFFSSFFSQSSFIFDCHIYAVTNLAQSAGYLFINGITTRQEYLILHTTITRQGYPLCPRHHHPSGISFIHHIITRLGSLVHNIIFELITACSQLNFFTRSQLVQPAILTHGNSSHQAQQKQNNSKLIQLLNV